MFVGVEQKVIAAFVALVLRLNEVLFKPLFLKILDWAIGASAVCEIIDYYCICAGLIICI